MPVCNDILIPIMADDGNVIGYKVGSPKKQGELIIPCIASGDIVGLKVASMKKQDDVGFEGIAIDGVTVAIKGMEYGLGMVLVFIDESSSIYYPNGQSNWDADVERFDTLVDEFGPPESAMVCHVYQPDFDIVPTGRTPPEKIQYRNVSRSPSLAEFIDIYNECKGGANAPEPSDVTLMVDNSGSMTRSTIEPGISQFENWLDDPAQHNGKAIPHRYLSYTNERWLDWINAWYETQNQQQG